MSSGTSPFIKRVRRTEAHIVTWDDNTKKTGIERKKTILRAIQYRRFIPPQAEVQLHTLCLLSGDLARHHELT
jgi:hypothetical protein